MTPRRNGRPLELLDRDRCGAHPLRPGAIIAVPPEPEFVAVRTYWILLAYVLCAFVLGSACTLSAMAPGHRWELPAWLGVLAATLNVVRVTSGHGRRA